MIGLAAYVLVIGGLVSLTIGFAAALVQYSTEKNPKLLRWIRLFLIIGILALVFGTILMLYTNLQTPPVFNGGRISVPIHISMSDWPVAVFFTTGSLIILMGLFEYFKENERNSGVSSLILGVLIILLGTIPTVQDLIQSF